MTSQLIPLTSACLYLHKNAHRILLEKRNTALLNPVWLRGVSSRICREALGNILIIAPRNYPLFLPAVQAIQALVAGNAVLWKPAPGTSRAAAFCSQLLHRAGLPEGLLHILDESPDAVAEAIEATPIHKVVCTGSGATGRAVLHTLAPHAIPAIMELSGQDAVLVRHDADLDLAAKAVAYGARLNQGQTCIAPQRLFIAAESFSPFLDRLKQQLLEFGDSIEKTQISINSVEVIVKLTFSGFSQTYTSTGKGSAAPSVSQGDFTQIIECVPIANDAQFLTLNAAHPSALGASIFTADEKVGISIARQINAGVVTINDIIVPTADPRLPFAGRGISGFGTTRGAEGLLEMTAPKAIAVRKGKNRPHLEPAVPGDDLFFDNYLKATCLTGWRKRLTALKSFLKLARKRTLIIKKR